MKKNLAEQKEKMRWGDKRGAEWRTVPRERKHEETVEGNVRRGRSVRPKWDHLGTLCGELEGGRRSSKAPRQPQEHL